MRRASLCSRCATVLHNRHVCTDERNLKTINTCVLQRQDLGTKFYTGAHVPRIQEAEDNAEVPTQTCMFSPNLRHPPACSSKYRLVLWVHRKIDRVHPVAERSLAQAVVTNPWAYVTRKKGDSAYSLYVCVDQGVIHSNRTLDKLLFFYIYGSDKWG
jgi:hypothetical protein